MKIGDYYVLPHKTVEFGNIRNFVFRRLCFCRFQRGEGKGFCGKWRWKEEGDEDKTQGEYAEEIRFYKSPPFFKLLRMTQGVFIILYQNRSKVKIIQNWGKKFKIATNLIFFEI